MLEILKRIENALLPMLENADAWTSVYVNYHRPFIERLWLPMKVDETHVRVNLHCVHPCTEADALFHPHPWPTAMRVIRGQYEMGMGVQLPLPEAPTDGENTPPPVSTRIVGQRGMAYEMTDPNIWHYIRPSGTGNVLTLMVSGEPWPEDVVRPNPSPPTAVLGPLRDEQVTHLLALFRGFFQRRQIEAAGGYEPATDV